MSNLLKTLFPCLPLAHEGSIRLPTTPTTSSTYQPISEKSALNHPLSSQPTLHPPPHSSKPPHLTPSSASTSIITLLLSAPSPSPHLTSQINSLAHQAGGWSEYLAAKILAALEAVLKAGEEMKDGGGWNEGMKGAYGRACEAAEGFEGFVKDHPVFCTVVALGVLAVLAPECLAWLGFEEVGILEGSWAARWQATYMGLVPKGSLFSFFQRLGMTKWRWMGGVVSEKQGLA